MLTTRGIRARDVVVVDDYECRRQIERAAAAAAANANLKTRRRKHYFDYKRRAELNSRRAAHIDIEHRTRCALLIVCRATVDFTRGNYSN